MKIAILGGAGAMGGIFGALLAKGGYDVTLVDVAQAAVDKINADALGNAVAQLAHRSFQRSHGLRHGVSGLGHSHGLRGHQRGGVGGLGYLSQDA